MNKIKTNGFCGLQTKKLNAIAPSGPVTSLFISGWAGYGCLFPCLSKKTRFVLPFDSGENAGADSLPAQGWDVVIGWSLGAHLCLKHIHKIRAKKVVLIAPFLDFCHGSSGRKVQEMIAGLDKNPGATVRWFWKLCGIKNAPKLIIGEREELKAGLKFLCQSRIDPGSLGTDLPLTLIHGLDDKIVPAGVSEEILEYLPHACYHALPYGHFIPEEEIIKVIYEQPD